VQPAVRRYSPTGALLDASPYARLLAAAAADAPTALCGPPAFTADGSTAVGQVGVDQVGREHIRLAAAALGAPGAAVQVLADDAPNVGIYCEQPVQLDAATGYVLAVAPAPSDEPFPSYRGLRAVTTGGVEVWRAYDEAALPIRNSNGLMYSAAVAGGVAFVAAHVTGRVTALSMATGAVLWSHAEPPPRTARHVVAGNDGTVYVLLTNGLSRSHLPEFAVALFPSNGSERWRVPLQPQCDFTTGEPRATCGGYGGMIVGPDGALFIIISSMFVDGSGGRVIVSA
jgi:outer membrane protein assembly factor BamB